MKYESALSVAQPVVHRWAIKHFHREKRETEMESSDMRETHTISSALPKTEVLWLQVIFNVLLYLKKKSSHLCQPCNYKLETDNYETSDL